MGVQLYNHKTQKTLTISRKVVFATKYTEIMTARIKILSQSLMLLVGTYQCKSALSPLPLVYCWVVYVQTRPTPRTPTPSSQIGVQVRSTPSPPV